jgi:hypothetical protein
MGVYMIKALELVTSAIKATRDGFREKHPYPFLISYDLFVKPAGPQRTLEPGARAIGSDSNPVVLAVLKSQPTFPDMITVGRTANNDILLADVQISKLHSYFRVTPTGLELADAGSRNGTFINEQPLPARGAASPARPGDKLRFGDLRFVLADAGTLWDWARD